MNLEDQHSSQDVFLLQDPLTKLSEQVAQIFSIPSLNFLKVSKDPKYGDLRLSPFTLSPTEDFQSHQLIDYIKTEYIPQQIFLNRSFVIQLLLPEMIQDGNHLLPWSSCLKIQRNCSCCLACVIEESYCHPSQFRSLLFASCTYSILLQAGISVDWFVYIIPVETVAITTTTITTTTSSSSSSSISISNSTTQEQSPCRNIFRSLVESILQQATAVYHEPLQQSKIFDSPYYDNERQMFRLSLLSKYQLPDWCYPLQDWYVPLGSYRYQVFCYLCHLLLNQLNVGRLLLFTDFQQSDMMKKCMHAAAAFHYDDGQQTNILLNKVKWVPCGTVYDDHRHECLQEHISTTDTTLGFVSARCIYSLWGGKMSHPTVILCPMQGENGRRSFAVDKWLYQYARMSTLTRTIRSQQTKQYCFDDVLSVVHPIEWNIFYTNVLTYYRILPHLCQELMMTTTTHSSTSTSFHLLTEWLAKTTSNFTQLYSQLRIVKDHNTSPSIFFLRQSLVILLQQQMKQIFQLINITPMETI